MIEMKSAPRKTTRSTKKKDNASMSPEDRRKMVAEAAYYRAEKRGFPGGEELHDWLAAEKQIDRHIKGRKSS